MEIDPSRYDEIAKGIHSDSSPVGIDAKKTHILILDMLMNIDQRLKNIERGLRSQNISGFKKKNP